MSLKKDVFGRKEVKLYLSGEGYRELLRAVNEREDVARELRKEALDGFDGSIEEFDKVFDFKECLDALVAVRMSVKEVLKG